MDNDINTPRVPTGEIQDVLNLESEQEFTLSQVIDEGNGRMHEMKIGNLLTGDLGLASGETLYGKFVIRKPKTTPTI
jgi:hypothetical protein